MYRSKFRRELRAHKGQQMTTGALKEREQPFGSWQGRKRRTEPWKHQYQS
jgi:hypothetical protein